MIGSGHVAAAPKLAPGKTAPRVKNSRLEFFDTPTKARPENAAASRGTASGKLRCGYELAPGCAVDPNSEGRQRRDSVFPFDHITVATVGFVTGIVTPLTSSQNTDDFIEWVGLNNTGDLQAAKLTGQMTAVLPAVFAGAQQTPGPKVQPPVLRPVEITTPNAQMRANANARGTYVDPLTGRVVPANTRLAADHIVPKDWIKQQPGFDKLTRAQQEFLLNHPLNTQGLPGPLNSSKGAKMPDEWFFYTGIPLNQNYIQDQGLRAQFLRGWIQQQINNFNAGNGNQ